MFILNIVTVRMVIADQIWMNANTLVLACTFEIVRVCAGLTAIAWNITRVGALVRIPIVTGVVFFNDKV